MHRTCRPTRSIALAGLCSALSGVLSGCLFLPQSTTRYDPACGILENHMTLQAYQVAAFGGCRNEGCAELLVLAGAVSAASFVVSGSVVVVGEVVYWLEAKGRCMVR
ncbi:hypothetical protein [Zoogloea dura]|jgi:hypothetical protein|uniref:hypothetical protein n=1 Tax=Zoogloea dura TaxID=2728840 RepID=UPI001F158E71|nr:hypothetical protein [Zoogloea dura]